MSLADRYQDAWMQKFGLGKGWVANWWPGTPVALGQRGVMHQGQLQYQGHVSDYGVSFDLDASPGPASGAWDFSSSMQASWEFGTDARVPGWEWLGNAKAGVQARFGSEEALLFSAGQTWIERVGNIDRLQADLARTALEQGMPLGQSVVVERQIAAIAVLLVSAGKSGEFRATAEAAANVPGGEGTIASFAGRLGVKTQSGGVSKQEYPDGMVLGFRIVTLGAKGFFLWRRIIVEQAGPTEELGYRDVRESDLDEPADDYFIDFSG